MPEPGLPENTSHDAVGSRGLQRITRRRGEREVPLIAPPLTRSELLFELEPPVPLQGLYSETGKADVPTMP